MFCKMLMVLIAPLIFGLVESNRDVRERQIVTEILNESKYDASIRPLSTNIFNRTGATLVTVNFFVRRFEELNDKKKEFKLELTLRESWDDKRLVYAKYPNNIEYLTISDKSKIWTPDLFISEAKSTVVHDSYIRVHPDGKVHYSESSCGFWPHMWGENPQYMGSKYTRINTTFLIMFSRVQLTLACPMNFRRFPFDKQTCELKLASFGFTSNDLILKWRSNDPINISSVYLLDIYKFDNFTYGNDDCQISTDSGVFSCLKADFTFKRQCNWYLIQVYIPCQMLVIVAYLSLWLCPKRHATARSIISLVTLLVMATNISKFNDNFPPTNHTKKIDVWTGVSLTFAFATLIEFVVVYCIANNGEGKDTDITPKGRNLNQKIDLISKIAYPILYVLFVIIYLICAMV